MGFYLFFDKFVHVYSVSWSSSLASITFCPAIPFLLLPLPNKFLLDYYVFFSYIYLLIGREHIYHGTTEEVGGYLVTISSLLAPWCTGDQTQAVRIGGSTLTHWDICPPKGHMCSFPGFYLISLLWFLFSPSVGDWTQGLALVSQDLYHWPKSSPPCLFLYFNDPSLINCLYDCGWGLITEMKATYQ